MGESDRDRYLIAIPALRWFGWGSPVGLGVFVLLPAASAALIRFAFL